MTEEQLHALIQAHLRRNGNQILVIGGHVKNFPAELREDPKLVLWDATDPDIYRKKCLPKQVSLVLFIQGIPHKVFDRVQAIASPGVVLIKYPTTTGRVKRYVRTEAMAMAMAMADEPAGGGSAPGLAGGAPAADAPVDVVGQPGGVPPGSGAPGIPDAPVLPQPEEELFDRIASNETLSALALEKFLEDYRKCRKRAESIPVLEAANEELRAKAEELRARAERLTRYKSFFTLFRELLQESEGEREDSP